MNENENQKIVLIDPPIMDRFHEITKKIDGLVDENRRLAVEIQDEKRARETLERQEVHVDSMPGKRLPFRYQINIPLPGGFDDYVVGSVHVSRDGPFICRRIYASVIVTDAPFIQTPGDFFDFREMIGRYAPISSSDLYAYWSNSGGNAAYPPLDFEWEYTDTGEGRNRQNRPLSGDILYRQDDDGYLMNNEIFAAGTTINFIIRPTRNVGFLEVLEGGVLYIDHLDLQFNVIFDGFKIIQPLEM